uniref:TVP38/TMEM64 family membrane protein n=1 Tax=Fundidesulfovibrio putealis TaxID=270496 RepID=A0A7C3WGH1_9BACT
MPRSSAAGRIALLALLGLCLAAFFLLDGPAYLNLETLKASRDWLQALYARHPVAMVGAFVGLYVLAAALSLPGAVVMTLAGSAIFGFWIGLLAVSFASSIGATLACACSRYLLRDMVASRFGPRLARLDAGLARDGAWYLLSLRLVPVIPFFLINLGMGLTAMPLSRFYWVSQLGMLPGTMVFVLAGTQLGRVERIGDVLSPGLLGALALLGMFPLLAKAVVRRLRRKPEVSGRDERN